MAFLIGTDEAGYGPNLGPLVVAQTIWRVPGDGRDLDLYRCLAPAIERHPDAARSVAIADSKQLYRPGGDLGLLEAAVLTAVQLIHQSRPADWRSLLGLVAPAALEFAEQIAWYRGYNPSLPTVPVDERTWRDRRNAWQTAQTAADVRLVGIRAALVYPSEFNAAVHKYHSKGALLSNVTLDLVADSIAGLDPSHNVRVVCDKHGGRNAYGPLLQPRFQDRLVRVECESRQVSRYEVGTRDRSIHISFQAKGEGFLPCALASMFAKYLREVSMQGFNRYWRARVADLRPTAGYPVDAKRFRAEIAAEQRRLAIDDHVLWRCR